MPQKYDMSEKDRIWVAKCLFVCYSHVIKRDYEAKESIGKLNYA